MITIAIDQRQHKTHKRCYCSIYVRNTIFRIEEVPVVLACVGYGCYLFFIIAFREITKCRNEGETVRHRDV